MPSESRSPWFAATICAALAAILAIALSMGLSAAADLPGPQGVAGEPGADGQDGAAGPAGAQGPAGADGLAGASGRNGVDGTDGLAGKNGKDGLAGTDGNDGLAGQDGNDGAAGNDGADGAPGADAVVIYAEANRVDGVYVEDEIFDTGTFTYSSTAALSLPASVDQALYVLQFSTEAITHDVGWANARFEIQCTLTGPADMTAGGTNQFLVLSDHAPRSFTDGKAADSLATFSPVSVTRVIRVNGTTGNVGVSCQIAHVNAGLADTDASLTLDKPTLVLYRT